MPIIVRAGESQAPRFATTLPLCSFESARAAPVSLLSAASAENLQTMDSIIKLCSQTSDGLDDGAPFEPHAPPELPRALPLVGLVPASRAEAKVTAIPECTKRMLRRPCYCCDFFQEFAQLPLQFPHLRFHQPRAAQGPQEKNTSPARFDRF